MRAKERIQTDHGFKIGLFLTALLMLLGFSVSGVNAVNYNPGGSDIAQSYQESFRRVARETLPVVVEVNVINLVEAPSFPGPFEFFFGRPDQNREERDGEKREFRQEGLGSGVIVRKEGDSVYILTNNHVVGQAEEIQIRLYDERVFEAELVGVDQRKDLALVRFKTDERIPVAKLGNSDSLQIGDWVFAVGNPMGFESTFTAGVVSAVGRETPSNSRVSSFTDYIQTDAAINPGNSGGALVNLAGEVVGINTWIASRTGGSVGIGFAIPINNAKKAITDLISSGSVEYGWLGVQVRDLSDESREDMDLDRYDGAFINSIFDGSPAEKAGILPGDYITAVDDERIEDRDGLVKVVAELRPGRTYRFRLMRNGIERVVPVRITRRDDEETIAQGGSVWPGFSVVAATDEIRESLGLSSSRGKVVVAYVTPESPAAAAGLRPGDIILRVDNDRIRSMEDFYRELNDSDSGEVMLRVYRSGHEAILGLVR